MRTEFGVLRSECNCSECSLFCQFMPGCLIPADLCRMIPEGSEVFSWAESNLLASPGALIVFEGQHYRIGTLVPAVKRDGSCIHFREGRCDIHPIAPFGCAFFSCKPESRELIKTGLLSILYDAGGLYSRLWRHLDSKGITQVPPEVLHQRINKARKLL